MSLELPLFIIRSRTNSSLGSSRLAKWRRQKTRSHDLKISKLGACRHWKINQNLLRHFCRHVTRFLPGLSLVAMSIGCFIANVCLLVGLTFTRKINNFINKRITLQGTYIPSAHVEGGVTRAVDYAKDQGMYRLLFPPSFTNTSVINENVFHFYHV